MASVREKCQQDHRFDNEGNGHGSNTEGGLSGISVLSAETYGFSRTNSQASTSSLTNEDISSSPDASPWHRISNGRAGACLTRMSAKLKMLASDVKYRHADADADYCGDGCCLIQEERFELMKERFAKLLLGEDMSGSGNGVCTSVAISNAIANLYATAFGQLYSLKPLNLEKRLIWKREMECLLSVCDYIVEFVPSWKDLPNGKKHEVMTNQIRLDIQMNLPALHKLETMLLGVLDSFINTEFWYEDQGSMLSDGDPAQLTPIREEKWWLPTPRVPPRGLSEKARKQIQQKRDCANQILKASMAINSSILSEMQVPETYVESLPKTGKAALGETIYKLVTNPDQFSPDYMLDCLDLTNEYNALDIANKVEAAMYVWMRKGGLVSSKSSWDLVKDFMVDADKMEMLTDRAKTLLLCLRQRCPALSQTNLDTCKIQYNRDVGLAVLESYSRILETLSYNIVALIDNVLHVDDAAKQSSGKLLKAIPTYSPNISKSRVRL